MSNSVCIYKAPNAIEGNVVKGLLESRGIAVRLDGESLVGAYSGVPLASEVRVMVAPEDETAARRVITEYENGGDVSGGMAAISWACAACGESNAGSFEHCWQCGTDRM